MRTVFSTAGVPQVQAYDCWMDVVHAHLHKVQGEVFDRKNFYAALEIETLGDVAFQSWRSGPGITRFNDVDDLLLVLPSSRSLIEFDDRRFEINRDNVYLIDCREPFVVGSIEAPERVQVRLPRDDLERCLPLSGAVNRPIPLEGDAAFLAAYAQILVRTGPSNLSPVAAATVHDHLLNLTARVLHQTTMGRYTPVSITDGPVDEDYLGKIRQDRKHAGGCQSEAAAASDACDESD